MVIDEIKSLLKQYEFKIITEPDYERAMEVYNTNPQYFMLTDEKEATLEDMRTATNHVPPNFKIDNKFFISIWEDDNCAGILDFLVGYPEQSCVWIGLLMIHGKMQGNRIGSQIANAVVEASRNKGYTSVQLGVLDNNIRALKFWGKLGFEKIRESQVKREVKPDWNVIVMEKRAV